MGDFELRHVTTFWALERTDLAAGFVVIMDHKTADEVCSLVG